MSFSQKKTKQLITIAIFLLKSHNPDAISNLKDFLTILPNGEKIEQILMTAINELMEKKPQTIYWLLENPTYLQPEIDIRFVVTQKLNEKLLAWEFKPEEIHFNDDGNLEYNPASKEKLLSVNYSSDHHTALTLMKLFLTELI